MAVSVSVQFNGVTFRRYPDAKRRADQVYFVPSASFRRQGVGRLHQEIWKAEHGPIPDGWHVHHIDGDPFNNDPSNLECKPGLEHLSEHGRDYVPAPGHMAAMQELASVWHGSDAGIAWHREHGRRTWENRAVKRRACEHCGSEYETRASHGNERFCSNNCKTAARLASGVDDEDRTCAGCGMNFRINRYRTARCCSRKCAWTVRRQN